MKLINKLKVVATINPRKALQYQKIMSWLESDSHINTILAHPNVVQRKAQLLYSSRDHAITCNEAEIKKLFDTETLKQLSKILKCSNKKSILLLTYYLPQIIEEQHLNQYQACIIESDQNSGTTIHDWQKWWQNIKKRWLRL